MSLALRSHMTGGVLRPPEGYKASTASLLMSSFAINILSLALPVMTLQIYDRILPNPGSGTLMMLIFGVSVAIALEAVLRLCRAFILGWSGAVFEHRLSCAAMKHLLAADLSRLSAAGMGEHLHRVGAIGKLKDFYNGYALMTLFELAFVPVFLGVMVYIIGPLAAVPAVVLMVFTLVSLAQGQKLRTALERRDVSDDARYNFLIESLEGVHTIKAFALEQIFARRYEALEEKSNLANFKVTESMAGAFNTGTVFSHIMVASVIAVGALYALQGHITTGALIAAVLLSGRMMQPIQRALAVWARYQDFLLARGKVETLFQTPLYAPVAASGPAPSREGLLNLESVSFRLDESQPWILEDANLSLKRGECVLFSSDSFEGRQTLLELIAGMYAPTRGIVRVDGQETGRYTPDQFIHHVGYLQTDGLIFRGTIRDNLTCFGQIPEAQAQEISALFNLNQDIARLSSGFDTFLNGSTQDSVPPGLKQRIAMARVLAPKPRIVLFDAADRSLDRNGYNQVYNLLARLKGQVTMILISEDGNIRDLASRHISLERGHLHERAMPANNGGASARLTEGTS